MGTGTLTRTEEDLLRGVTHTSKGFYGFVTLLLAIIVWAVYAWSTALTEGHAVTGLSNFVPWGIYIASYIFFIGISHAGIAISAATRILKLEKFKPITRMAELITVICLTAAALTVIVDVGRPDRMFNMFLYLPERVGQSPFIGGTLITMATYLILSITYLYFSMREDLAAYRDRVRWKRLYNLMLPFYSPDEKQAVDKLLWWMAVAIIPVMVMVHTTVAWVFGLIASKPGWFNPGAGIDYVVAAIASGLAAVSALSIMVRRRFKWQNYIDAGIFKGFGFFIMGVVLVYLYLIYGETYTGVFFSPAAETNMTLSLLIGRYAPLYWTVIVGLLISVIIYFAPVVDRKAFNLGAAALSGLLVVAVLWIKRVVIVVPALFAGYPTLPFPVYEWELDPLWGLYAPTWVEWSVLAGIFAFAGLAYALFIKIFPIIPISEVREMRD